MRKCCVANTLYEDELGWFMQLFHGDQNEKISNRTQSRAGETFTRGFNHQRVATYPCDSLDPPVQIFCDTGISPTPSDD